MTKADYAERLKDPRWIAFRDDFVRRAARDFQCEDWNTCPQCGREDCPVDKRHLHHRRYIKGREPWEYEDSDLLLICSDCHEEVHDLERRVRAFVISMDPHMCREFNDLMEELEAAQREGFILKVSLAHCKNAVRHVLNS